MQQKVSTDAIRLRYDAKTWEEAVTLCGELLEGVGCVKHDYVNAMIDTVKTLGPYIVIAPGLAMPHAKRTDSVLKSGISIVTLENPIPFGNAANDPVYMLIGLAGVNDDLHMDIMAAIADIFEDENRVYELAKCDDAEQLANVFNEMEVNLT